MCFSLKKQSQNGGKQIYLFLRNIDMNDHKLEQNNKVYMEWKDGIGKGKRQQ